MKEFHDIINKKLKAVSFMTSFEGYPNYNDDVKADFDYLPLGGLTMLFEDKSVYCIADYFSTPHGTNGIGVKRLDQFQQLPNADRQKGNWNNKIGKEIKAIRLYWNKEAWNNGLKNEFYPESIELIFDNQSIFYFCGDVDDFNVAENQYNLLAGRDSGLIFYSSDSFKKYQLDKVQRVEELVI